jgi:two-component system CheB/CheR fusion protein
MTADSEAGDRERPPALPEAEGGAEVVRPGDSRFPIVGIGASAGGLEAYRQLLEKLPADTGMAFVLVQHLDPRHESRLTDLLGRTTPMPVLEVTDGLSVQPNHVYVIPPNANLAIAQSVFQITPRGEERAPHLPVDFLFRSLAEDRKARAVAVVLSGTGSDGTLGMCEIKARGGITFAQDETSARHSGMPRSAADSGCVDFVLTPEAIALRLADIGQHPYLTPAVTPQDPVDPGTEDLYKRILSQVRSASGVDFSQYRASTIRRRILRRMALRNQQSLAGYLQHLEGDRAEAEALYHELLVNVTSFFRDPELFDALKQRIFPEIVAGRPLSAPLRVWVPGCSTGQECYSLAMALVEYFDDRPVRPPIQVFGTDLSDPNSLDKARAGIYPESIEGELSPERLRRFFVKEDHHCRMSREIRDLTVFARHDVTADPPFSHVDLISCRNLLIYLSTPLQRQVLPTFHYALDVPGFLVLGSAETVGDHGDLFEIVDRTHKIYAKKATAVRSRLHFATHDLKTSVGPAARRAAGPGSIPADFQREADRILLGRYSPPGVLVNENLDIVQFRGRTSPYLEPPPGEPTTNVLKMAREGLFLELRSALAEAGKENRQVRREGVRLRAGGDAREIGLEVVPVKPPGAGDACFLVLFHEAASPGGDAAAAEAPPLLAADPAAHPAADQRELVLLRQELGATKEYMQSLVEQQDAANEALRSANEEILSRNEELQSTNEELETAKEELQSANEELTTVNEQLQHRNLELTQANDDLSNLLSSAALPVVMVGGDLRIRRFTEPAKDVLSLLPADVGQPLGDLKPAVDVPDFDKLIERVVATGERAEREVQDRAGRWYSLRVHPYRTAGDEIDGAVIVLVDVDQARRAQQELLGQAAQLRRQASLLELSQDAIIVRDAENRILSWNRGAQEMYGWAAEEALGKPLDALLHTSPGTWAELNAELDAKGTWEGELRQARRHGATIIVHIREVVVRDEAGRRSAVLSIKRDVTELKRAMEALLEADRRKDEFLATLAHELRNPIAPIRNALEILQRVGDDAAAIAPAREVLERQVGQLSRIVEDLIDVSRIVEQKVELRKERVLLAGLVQTAVESCNSVIEASHHRFSVSLPPEPLYVDVDPARMSQVLTNLLNNAVKYTPEGGEIGLSAERAPIPAAAERAAEAAELVIRVRDTGIGIEASFLPRVFDMYAQGDTLPERTRAGLGVGLTLVRSLVQMHGGRIEAHSDGPGHGSEFVLYLPLAERGSGGRDARSGALRSEEPRDRGPRKILVVDDNEDQAQSLSRLLRMLGHEVHLAFDGASALKEAADFVPDVALLDLGLPGINGYEVARCIRSEPRLRHVVLVAQTGWGQSDDRSRSAAAGFDHHLVKPVDFERLRRILADVPVRRTP